MRPIEVFCTVLAVAFIVIGVLLITGLWFGVPDLGMVR